MATLSYLRDRKKWRVRWRATNRKHKRVLSGSRCFADKVEAARFFADMEAQEKVWRTGDALPSQSLMQVVESFFSYCKRHTKRTQGHYHMVIRRFVDSLPNILIPLQQIEEAHIYEYIYRLQEDNVTNRTCNAHLTPIKAFCRYYSRWYKIANPADQVQMLKEDPPQSRFLTTEELGKVLAITSPLQRDRILFIANTGLRASEYCLLRWCDFNRAAQTITVLGKGRKRRVVPLNRTCLEILSRLRQAQPADPIFVSKRRPVTPNALYLQFCRLAAKAKMRKFGPHALRHYFATQLLLAGTNRTIVSKILGHSSSRLTEKLYIHIPAGHLVGATDCLEPIGTAAQ